MEEGLSQPEPIRTPQRTWASCARLCGDDHGKWARILDTIADNEDADAKDRIAAIRDLHDRGWGKAPANALVFDTFLDFCGIIASTITRHVMVEQKEAIDAELNEAWRVMRQEVCGVNWRPETKRAGSDPARDCPENCANRSYVP